MSQIIKISGNYSIGTPPRRARTRKISGDYFILPKQPQWILVKVSDTLVPRLIRVKVGDSLADA